MPYITQNSRIKFLPCIDAVPAMENAGELNFLLTRICLNYLHQHGVRYQYLNDVLGVLTAMPLELNRRVIGHYEDCKKTENGDVYDRFVG